MLFNISDRLKSLSRSLCLSVSLSLSLSHSVGVTFMIQFVDKDSYSIGNRLNAMLTE